MTTANILKKLVLIIIWASFCSNIYSQIRVRPRITVDLKIVAKGTPEFYPEKIDDQNFFVHIVLRNNEDSTIKFLVRECSWGRVDFIVENDSIYLLQPGCDIDSPMPIKLNSGSSIDFYGMLRARKKDLLNKEFRLGFIYFTSVMAMMNYQKGKLQKTGLQIYWSKKIRLEENLFKYKQ